MGLVSNDPQYLTGRMLLAMPGMFDPRFERSVTVMCQHDDKGAMGVGIGKLRKGIDFHTMLADFDIDPGETPNCPLHHGGPVETSRGFVLHSDDWSGSDTIRVGTLCSLTHSLDVIRAIAEGRGPRHWLVALGYAGWLGGQLEGEMRQHGWYAAEGHREVLWDTPAENRWLRAWQAEGIDPALLATQTGRA